LIVRTWALAFVAMAAGGTATAQDSRAIPTLLLTGASNHNWRYTSRLHADTLEATKHFDVTISDDPAKALADREALEHYRLIVLDYNSDQRWPAAAEKNLVEAVRGGTGLVAIHAANNAFPGWTDYESMLGLVWREGAGHGKFHPFAVRYVDIEHPVVAGLPDMAFHPDELYHGLTNPQHAKIRYLATAFSDEASGGTQQDEAMAIAVEFGKGRVFATPLGHVWEHAEDTKASISDPQFKILLCRGAEWAATGAVTQGIEWEDVRQHNTNPPARAGAWTLLFDGSSTAAWRGYKEKDFPSEGWVVEGDTLHHPAGTSGPDLVTRDEYTDFEFECQWKVAPGGNSGIMYRVGETEDASYMTGPEMQVLDNARHPDAKNTRTSAGAIYGLVPCGLDVVRPAGEWNRVRIVVNKNHVEHWMNGWKVAEAQLNSPEWDALIKGTKFEPWKDFGRLPTGRIALQNHGDDVWYRDLRVRALPLE
jgi:type 1 glutamine amidotransferase